jgi:hypothetical protein
MRRADTVPGTVARMTLMTDVKTTRLTEMVKAAG